MYDVRCWHCFRSQMWFFHQHNAVTRSRFSDPALSHVSNQVLWPSPAQCTTCAVAVASMVEGGASETTDTAGYDPNVFDTAAVQAYLRDSYSLASQE
jgi:hypothetical protein